MGAIKNLLIKVIEDYARGIDVETIVARHNLPDSQWVMDTIRMYPDWVEEEKEFWKNRIENGG